MNYGLGPWTKSALINFNGPGASTIVAGVAGQSICIMKLVLVVSQTTNITMQDTTAALAGPLSMLANGSITLIFDGAPWWTTSIGAGFQIASSNASLVGGSLQYQLMPG